MRVDFHKMHGAGNDFVVLDARARFLPLQPETVAALACRRTGIGFDQLALIEPDDAPETVSVRFFNADGSESGACGNASRCIAWLACDGVAGAAVSLRTRAGILPARILEGGARGGQVSVRLGHPRLDWRDIPLSRAADTLHLPLPGDPAGCSMGNPHATLFDPALDPVVDGPRLQRDPLFAEGANIGFATVLAPDRMRLRVFERGSGLTLACGSGACAAVVNAARRGLAGREVAVQMDGGLLHVRWADDGVHLAGPAVLSFTGSVTLDPASRRGDVPDGGSGDDMSPGGATVPGVVRDDASQGRAAGEAAARALASRHRASGGITSQVPAVRGAAVRDPAVRGAVAPGDFSDGAVLPAARSGRASGT